MRRLMRVIMSAWTTFSAYTYYIYFRYMAVASFCNVVNKADNRIISIVDNIDYLITKC